MGVLVIAWNGVGEYVEVLAIVGETLGSVVCTPALAPMEHPLASMEIMSRFTTNNIPRLNVIPH